MSEQAAYVPQGGDVMQGNGLGRITVLEALAEETRAVGLSRSNQSTKIDATTDPDDQ